MRIRIQGGNLNADPCGSGSETQTTGIRIQIHENHTDAHKKTFTGFLYLKSSDALAGGLEAYLGA